MEEEAWNAYPYTKTIYRCPFIEKFVLEIETVYHNDGGGQDNVFNLSPSQLHERTVGEYCTECRREITMLRLHNTYATLTLWATKEIILEAAGSTSIVESNN